MAKPFLHLGDIRLLIKERQQEGIAQAKKRGAYKGRKKSLS
jgi:DNA invertase Pin-like site-specific DNA recombinase